jgi:hypothetical protein
MIGQQPLHGVAQFVDVIGFMNQGPCALGQCALFDLGSDVARGQGHGQIWPDLPGFPE